MEPDTTIRGNWNIGQTTKEITFPATSVSYLMEASAALKIVMVRAESVSDCTKILSAEPTSAEEQMKIKCENENAAAAANCPGSDTEPTANPGYLCLYQTASTTPKYAVKGFPFTLGTKWGATVTLEPGTVSGAPTPIFMFGTWAAHNPA
jgi:hypothetical protein